MSHYSTKAHKDVSKNLSIKNKSADQGLFELNGDNIYFTITSNEGTVIYDGKVNEKYYRDIKGKSLITGMAKQERYYFVKTKGK